MLAECVLYVSQCLRAFVSDFHLTVMNRYAEMLIENDKYINMNINIDLYHFYVQMSVSESNKAEKTCTNRFCFLLCSNREKKMKLEMLTWSKLCC